MIASARLDLVPGTIALLEAELESNDRLASLLGARVPGSWPPGEYDRGAIAHFRQCLRDHPDAVGWYVWYAVLRGTGKEPRALVGAGGYFGPPNAEGTVEIGYSIVPECTGQGYATELVHALVDHVLASKQVRGIIAHTNMENVGSVKVLERVGFRMTGAAEESGSVTYALYRPVTRQTAPDGKRRC
jgi:RimJ/RimL family protein N-acetyltransferase